MTAEAKLMRDTRIDVLRALALLTIFINHVPGTIYEHFTTKNFGFSDADMEEIEASVETSVGAAADAGEPA